MGALLSVYWKLTQHLDELDSPPTHAGTWKSEGYSASACIRGDIKMVLNLPSGSAQVLIIYDEQSSYRTGWRVKTDLVIEGDVSGHTDTVGSATVSSSTIDLNSKTTFSTLDQKLGFRVQDVDEESGALSGSYISSTPVDHGTWRVKPCL